MTTKYISDPNAGEAVLMAQFVAYMAQLQASEKLATQAQTQKQESEEERRKLIEDLVAFLQSRGTGMVGRTRAANRLLALRWVTSAEVPGLIKAMEKPTLDLEIPGGGKRAAGLVVGAAAGSSGAKKGKKEAPPGPRGAEATDRIKQEAAFQQAYAKAVAEGRTLPLSANALENMREAVLGAGMGIKNGSAMVPPLAMREAGAAPDWVRREAHNVAELGTPGVHPPGALAAQFRPPSRASRNPMFSNGPAVFKPKFLERTKEPLPVDGLSALPIKLQLKQRMGKDGKLPGPPKRKKLTKKEVAGKADKKQAGEGGKDEGFEALFARVVDGPSETFPHMAAIMAAAPELGSMLSNVRAYIGDLPGQLLDHCGAHGAVVDGVNVLFAKHPSLELASHEAVHVAQQKAGMDVNGRRAELEQDADDGAAGIMGGRAGWKAYAETMGGRGWMTATPAPTSRKPGDVGEEVEQLATQLGLSAGEVDIRTDGEAQQRTASQSAEGLMADGVVYLQPSVDLRSPSGKKLLGHELAHVAQAKLPEASVEPGAPRIRAESEAETIGHDFAAGRAIGVPTQGLLSRDMAANSDLSDEGIIDKIQAIDLKVRSNLDDEVIDDLWEERLRLIQLLERSGKSTHTKRVARLRREARKQRRVRRKKRYASLIKLQRKVEQDLSAVEEPEVQERLQGYLVEATRRLSVVDPIVYSGAHANAKWVDDELKAVGRLLREAKQLAADGDTEPAYFEALAYAKNIPNLSMIADRLKKAKEARDTNSQKGFHDGLKHRFFERNLGLSLGLNHLKKSKSDQDQALLKVARKVIYREKLLSRKCRPKDLKKLYVWRGKKAPGGLHGSNGSVLREVLERGNPDSIEKKANTAETDRQNELVFNAKVAANAHTLAAVMGNGARAADGFLAVLYPSFKGARGFSALVAELKNIPNAEHGNALKHLLALANAGTEPGKPSALHKRVHSLAAMNGTMPSLKASRSKARRHRYITGPVKGVILGRKNSNLALVGGVLAETSGSYASSKDDEMEFTAAGLAAFAKGVQDRLQVMAILILNGVLPRPSSPEKLIASVKQSAFNELESGTHYIEGFDYSLKLLDVSKKVGGQAEHSVRFVVVRKHEDADWKDAKPFGKARTTTDEAFEKITDSYLSQSWSRGLGLAGAIVGTIAIGALTLGTGFLAGVSLGAAIGGSATSITLYLITADDPTWGGVFRAALEGLFLAKGLQLGRLLVGGVTALSKSGIKTALANAFGGAAGGFLSGYTSGIIAVINGGEFEIMDLGKTMLTDGFLSMIIPWMGSKVADKVGAYLEGTKAGANIRRLEELVNLNWDDAIQKAQAAAKTRFDKVLKGSGAGRAWKQLSAGVEARLNGLRKQIEASAKKLGIDVDSLRGGAGLPGAAKGTGAATAAGASKVRPVGAKPGPPGGNAGAGPTKGPARKPGGGAPGASGKAASAKPSGAAPKAGIKPGGAAPKVGVKPGGAAPKAGVKPGGAKPKTDAKPGGAAPKTGVKPTGGKAATKGKPGGKGTGGKGKGKGKGKGNKGNSRAQTQADKAFKKVAKATKSKVVPKSRVKSLARGGKIKSASVVATGSSWRLKVKLKKGSATSAKAGWVGRNAKGKAVGYAGKSQTNKHLRLLEQMETQARDAAKPLREAGKENKDLHAALRPKLKKIEDTAKKKVLKGLTVEIDEHAPKFVKKESGSLIEYKTRVRPNMSEGITSIAGSPRSKESEALRKLAKTVAERVFSQVQASWKSGTVRDEVDVRKELKGHTADSQKWVDKKREGTKLTLSTRTSGAANKRTKSEGWPPRKWQVKALLKQVKGKKAQGTDYFGSGWWLDGAKKFGRDTKEAAAIRDRLSTDRTALAGAKVEKDVAPKEVYDKRLQEAKALRTKGTTWLNSQLAGSEYKLDFDGKSVETVTTPSELKSDKKKVRVEVHAKPGLMVAGDIALTAAQEHPDLRAAVEACTGKHAVVTFMLRLGSGESIGIGGGKSYGLEDLQGADKGWDYKVGKAFVNRQYLKRLFRAAKAKSHEWIPTNRLVQVIERDHATRDQLSEAAKWVQAQHVLRSPTRGIVFKGRFEEFKEVVDAWKAAKVADLEKATADAKVALNSGADVFSKHGFLSGHVGALYVKDTDNKLHPCVTGQEAFHNRLRTLWDDYKEDPKSYVGEVLAFVEAEVWDGTFSDDTFPEKLAEVTDVDFKDARGIPLPQDPEVDTSGIKDEPEAVKKAGVAFVKNLAELGVRQSKNYSDLLKMLTRAEKELT